MADDADRAQVINERHLEAALGDRRSRQPTGESLTHCEDCEGRIPEARRAAQPGCRKCVACQQTLELLTHWRN